MIRKGYEKVTKRYENATKILRKCYVMKMFGNVTEMHEYQRGSFSLKEKQFWWLALLGDYFSELKKDLTTFALPDLVPRPFSFPFGSCNP